MIGNKIKICDFGLSSQNSFHFGYVGTPEFMAPEIIERKVYNHKVDIWSFGIILFDLVFGFTPFGIKQIGSSQIDRDMTQVAICKKKLTFPEDTQFNDVIKKCLEKDPTKRISIEELYQNDLFSKLKV